MLSISERELNKKDLKILTKRKAELNKQLNSYKKFLGFWIASCFVLTIIFVTVLDQKLLLLLLVTSLVYAGIGVWVFLEQYFKRNKNMAEINSFISYNKVQSIIVKSNKYYELVEEEDEGVYYLFQVEPNKILSFGGQDFYSDKKFPNSEFEIVIGKSPNGEYILLEKYCFGDKILPERKIKGKQKMELMGRIETGEFCVIEGVLEEFA